MRRMVLVISLFVVMLGCKGPEGSKGEPGDQGIPGLPGGGVTMDAISGAVNSNDFTVTDAKLADTAQISVYIAASQQLSELPYLLPSEGVNTYFIFKSPNQVQIVNAQLAGATSYLIVILYNT